MADLLDPSLIQGWHVHVYFDGASREAARGLRERILEAFGPRITMGRFHEKPVGPHPMWSYQLGVSPEEIAAVLGWLSLNHGALDVFVHPNTGDELRDHRDSALWIGHSHALDLTALGG